MRGEVGLRTSDKECIRRTRLMKEERPENTVKNSQGGVVLELWEQENGVNPQRTWALAIEDDYRSHMGDATARIRLDDEEAGFLRRAFEPGPEEANDA